MYGVMNHKGQVRSYLTERRARNGFRMACYRSLPKNASIDEVCEAQSEYDRVSFGDIRQGLYWRDIWCKPVSL